MGTLIIDNYAIDTPLYDIIQRLRATITTGKLKDIEPKGEYIMLTCPHHKDGREAHPDCGVYVGDDPKKTYGFVHCFACGWAVPFVTFVQECFESSEAYAKNWLISNYGKAIGTKVYLGAPIVLNKKNKVKVLANEELDDYSSWCPYLTKRRISRATCIKFNVKYDAEHRQVVFPCYDELGRFVMMARRSIDSKIFYMDKNVEKPVYGLDKISENNIKTVIVTEGLFDALSANEYGFPAVATLGTPSIEQINKINKSCITTVYTMFDNDEAGRAFTKLFKEKLSKRILVREVKVPDPYKDINDLSKEDFIKAIETAQKTDKIVLKFAKRVV